jgi:ppGpp synthetase/RelA/SpoT-type nucleotidyltranferase
VCGVCVEVAVMAEKLSRSQVDQLGERIRGSEISETDLQLLDAYRRSFAQAYEHVVNSVRNDLEVEPTGRPTKSTTSISDKLARESIRLSQMQDIAGCRIVVPDILAQDALIARFIAIFDVRSVFDRRKSPSSGYRAVHVIVRHLERPIEIQIRTALQHIWAELSEKLSDVVDPSVKYGGGPAELKDILLLTSQSGADVEECEKRLQTIKDRDPGDHRDEIADLEKSVMESKQDLAEMMRRMIRDAHIWMDI